MSVWQCTKCGCLTGPDPTQSQKCRVCGSPTEFWRGPAPIASSLVQTGVVAVYDSAMTPSKDALIMRDLRADAQAVVDAWHATLSIEMVANVRVSAAMET